MSRKEPRLGKGLDALLGDLQETENEPSNVEEVSVKKIQPNSFQPRREFSEEKLEELAESIRIHGVVQPVIVRADDGSFELVAGERRWRAAQMVGLERIPAIIGNFTERDMMEVALVENVQREDLSPVEEATAYRSIQKEFGLTQAQLAQRIGMSRSQVANVLRLLKLPDKAQQLVQANRLGIGHAKVVLGVPEDIQAEFAQMIAEQEMTVRQAEQAADEIKDKQQSGKDLSDENVEQPREPEDSQQDVFLRDVEDRIEGTLGARVSIDQQGDKGQITIQYFDREDLQRIIDILLND